MGRGVQDQPDLIGERAAAGGSVRGELVLVQLDEVLGLAAGAVDNFEEMAALGVERGDDVAGVEATRGRFPRMPPVNLSITHILMVFSPVAAISCVDR